MLVSAVCGRHSGDGNGLVECREQPQDQILTKCFQKARPGLGRLKVSRTHAAPVQEIMSTEKQACCQNLIIWWRILSLECKKKLLKGRSKE